MKHVLRKEFREKRKALTLDSYEKKSAAIREKLENLSEFRSSQKIMAYVSTEEEVDTRELIRDCFAKNQTVYIPKVDRNELKIMPVNKWEVLEPGAYSILEPMLNTGEEADPMDLDLILVPGIAFDKKGHRIGYGGGFYDKVLKKTPAIRVGLCFDEQLVDEIPNEPHDVPMNIVITDSKIYFPNH